MSNTEFEIIGTDRVASGHPKALKATDLDNYNFRWFTLAPLYVYASVHFSIPAQYEREYGKQNWILLEYPQLVLNNVGSPLGSYLEGIESSAWDNFSSWMASISFRDTSKSEYWKVSWADISVDSKPSLVVMPDDYLEKCVRVFLPDGNKGQLQVSMFRPPANLYWSRPRPELTEECKAIFSIGEKP